MTTNTRAHAVLIGVDDYSTYDATNKHNLLGCLNDVRAFWDVCVTSGFAPENIHVLTNPPIDPAELGGLAQNFQTAKRGNILAQHETLLGRLRADSRAVGLLKLSLTGDGIPTDVLSKIEIIQGTEFWSLGGDFMSELSGASAAAHTGLGFRTSASVPAPSSPVTTFRMPTSVNWGTAVPAPTGAAFYSMAGAGPAVVVLRFEIDKNVSPARVIGIHWYQGVVDGTPQTYALTLPGREFAFADQMPAPPARLTWFHAFVTPI